MKITTFSEDRVCHTRFTIFISKHIIIVTEQICSPEMLILKASKNIEIFNQLL